MTTANIPALPPDKAEDIRRAFAKLNAQLEVSGKHPSMTRRASSMIFHQDGTTTHFSYRRPMTNGEAERELSTTVARSLDRLDDQDRSIDQSSQSLWGRLVGAIGVIFRLRR